VPQGKLLGQRCDGKLFGSLKVERLLGERFQTIRQTEDEVLSSLLWFNYQRLHSALKYLSHVESSSGVTNTIAGGLIARLDYRTPREFSIAMGF